MSISDWVEMIQAAGFDARSMTVEDVHHLGGRIMRDHVVQAYRLANNGDVVLRINSMTAIEKTELRKRLTASA